MNISRHSIPYYIHRWFFAYGLDLPKTIRAIRWTPSYLFSFFNFRHQIGRYAKDWPVGLTYPELTDRGESGGSSKGHYFHQDLYVAQRIHENNPLRHIDVGSRVDGFVAHVAAFRDIEVLDIRPNVTEVRRIKFAQCDLMNPPTHMHSICDSLSCLHTLEHFGLGRYGDPLAPDGYRLGFQGLIQLLKPNGRLYLSVPIGEQRIEFNAHRVFSVGTILELANTGFTFDRFAYVDDEGAFHKITPEYAQQATAGLIYGCGIFEFVKGD